MNLPETEWLILLPSTIGDCNAMRHSVAGKLADFHVPIFRSFFRTRRYLFLLRLICIREKRRYCWLTQKSYVLMICSASWEPQNRRIPR